jgi:hypothetical protein
MFALMPANAISGVINFTTLLEGKKLYGSMTYKLDEDPYDYQLGMGGISSHKATLHMRANDPIGGE